MQNRLSLLLFNNIRFQKVVVKIERDSVFSFKVIYDHDYINSVMSFIATTIPCISRINPPKELACYSQIIIILSLYLESSLYL